jgi:tRNA threonylcarbamoyladenosine modification (KEOPS) complex Cgi121 subunit
VEPSIRGYRAEVSDVPGLLRRLASARGALPVQLVRADRVYGPDHLRHAAALAARALAQGRARAADLPTETAVYAAGERQVGKALAFLGLAEGVTGVAAVAWGPDAEAALDAFAEAEGWTRDDARLAGGSGVLDAFLVTPEERAMLPASRWGEFVLERVALVDVLKA